MSEPNPLAITCVRCARRSPAGKLALPSKTILVTCSFCGHRGRYTPSSILRSSQQGLLNDRPVLTTPIELAARVEHYEAALSAGALAKLLAVSQRQVYRWIAKGDLPSIRIGGTIRLDPALVSIWLRSKKN